MSQGSNGPGYCRWTYQNGVWSVENECSDGHRCLEVSSSTPQQTVGGVSVGWNNNGTIDPPSHGIPDAAFRNLVAQRYTRFELEDPTHAALYPNGGVVPPGAAIYDIPCVPETEPDQDQGVSFQALPVTPPPGGGE